jgi:hypothetical protein
MHFSQIPIRGGPGSEEVIVEVAEVVGVEESNPDVAISKAHKRELSDSFVQQLPGSKYAKVEVPTQSVFRPPTTLFYNPVDPYSRKICMYMLEKGVSTDIHMEKARRRISCC